tara:strand:+ start:3081 stop:3527 length:447 start_codon:yes stop_codon:yes gene_type:complete
MGGIRFFGDPSRHQDWIDSVGLELALPGQSARHLLICTHDNQSADPLERLQGTILPMREAMSHVEAGQIESVVLVTDGAGYAGPRKIARAPLSATFNDAHGMGSLTSEVLANIAKKAGVRVSILHGQPEVDEALQQAILSEFVSSIDD